MNIFTNKFPLTRSHIACVVDNKIEGLDGADLVPVGTAFKVVAIDANMMNGIFLRNKDIDIMVTAEILKLAFVESEVEV
jgi:hypothetical protein